MKYNIRTKNINLTPAMEIHIQNTFNKLVKYQQVNENDIVRVDLEHLKENKTKITVFIDIKGKFNALKAEVRADDFYKGVDQLLHKLEEQIRKIKTKTYHHRTESVATAFFKEQEVSPELEEIE